jgi:hypothetical protein
MKLTKTETIILVGMAVVVCIVLVAAVSAIYFVSRTPAAPVVTAMVIATNPPVTSTPVPPAAFPPTWTPTPRASAECQNAALEYLRQIFPHINKYKDSMQLAGSTARIALSPVVQDMQEARRDIEQTVAPPCALPASKLLISSMNNTINALTEFMNGGSDSTVARYLAQSALELENATDQLLALSSGKPTPVPKNLPTATPLPTLLPTLTPLPAGNPVVINDSDGNPWQIKVTKVLVAATLKPTYSKSVEKAAGRFAIVFMEVTNRGLSPETFVAFGTLNVRDASGQRFEANDIASFYAQDLYGADICAEINPDGTKHCVAVYDISKQSDFYMLIPGSLADPNAPTVFLKVP